MHWCISYSDDSDKNCVICNTKQAPNTISIDEPEENLQLDSFVFFDYLFSRAYCFWCERKSCVSFVLICFSFGVIIKRWTESLSNF